ncbi:hypothetical protein GGF32_001331 [Allomyces javanicus]|nr:hypothetical protein GGF32_001331 [Allomyces javanicus]
MPPKTDAKKKKKSKKELEQERLLLEEQKRKEEEAARLAELARQRERELAEQQEREARDALLESKEPDFAAEILQSDEVALAAEHYVTALLQERERDRSWELYIQCSRIPNPKIESDVATYLSVFRQVHEKQSFGGVQEDLVQTEMLSALLEQEYAQAVDFRYALQAARYVENIRSLRQAVLRKLEAITAYSLQNSEQFPRESTENLLVVQQLHSSVTFALWCNVTKNPRHKAFDVDAIHVTLPKALTLANVAICLVHDRSGLTLNDLYLQQTSARKQIVMSGCLDFSLLELPELPKTVDFWTIRPLLSNNLSVKHVEYPFARGNGDMAAPEQEGGREDDASIFVSFSVGLGLHLHPLATVKWWCAETCTWNSDGITDVEIDRTKGTVQFKSSVLKPCALVQDAVSDFPLEDWKMRTVSVDPPVVRLTVNGKWTDVEFEITESGVSLIRPMNDRLQDEFQGKSFMPTLLIMKLFRYGIGFASPFMGQVDAEERGCYRAMASKCLALSFQAHKANAQHNGCVLTAMDAKDVAYTIVADYHLKIVEKERKVCYCAAEEDLSKPKPETAPHGTVLAVLEDIAPGLPTKWQVPVLVLQLLTIICPLNTASP